MKHTLTALILATASLAPAAASAQDFGLETIDYRIEWRWGPMDITAAHSHVEATCTDANLYATLNGSSIDWRGRVYSVSDTLRATVTPTSQHIDYINGWYTKPKSGEEASYQNPEDFRTIMGQGELSASDATMLAIGTTANILDMLYYAKAFDFENMEIGDCITIPITQDDVPDEYLEIEYIGRSPSPSGTYEGDVYNLVLRYSHNGEASKYPVACEISADSLLPVYYAADIRIGHVAMIAE